MRRVFQELKKLFEKLSKFSSPIYYCLRGLYCFPCSNGNDINVYTYLSWTLKNKRYSILKM